MRFADTAQVIFLRCVHRQFGKEPDFGLTSVNYNRDKLLAMGKEPTSMNTIEKMTLDELKQLVVDLMEERRLAYLFGEVDMDEAELGIEDEQDNRTLVQVLDSVARNRWTPPAGSPTPSEMLRQDRDEN